MTLPRLCNVRLVACKPDLQRRTVLNWQESVGQTGFAIIPEVMQHPEIERLLADLSQTTLKRSRAGVRHALAHPAVTAIARDPRLFGIAQEVLGPDTLPFRATLFDKSSDANWLVVWHQDTALPLRERREAAGWGPWSVKDGVIYAHSPASALCQVLALRIHLDDSAAENGPLRVLPATHTCGVLSDDTIHQLAGEISAVECLVATGGVLAMRPLLVHASSKSQTNNPRRVLHIEYASAPIIEQGMELAIA
jgi:ectoine hydroxylase-related dioxygenase (phytanoyl-CoA dioxygenase family)